MADLQALERRVQVLEDIEAIKRLKARYFRYLDSQRWDDLRELYAQDATTDYGDGQYAFEGVDAIMDFLSRSLGALRRNGRMLMHVGHMPDIEITGETTASGYWALDDYSFDPEPEAGRRMGAYYHDEYVKTGGEWKISSGVLNEIMNSQ